MRSLIPVAELAGRCRGSLLEPLAPRLSAATAAVLRSRRHGLTDRWLASLDALPAIAAKACACDQPVVTIGARRQIDDKTRLELRRRLLELSPWRKGPFRLFGIDIDAEWRSDMKWARIAGKVGSLAGKNILDVGCGNGYYMWRMSGAGAGLVLGLDPSQLCMAQFQALRRYCPAPRLVLLPLRLEEFPAQFLEQGFDAVFSMGVLYHRRAAADHLRALKQCLAPGGMLVLETLIIELSLIHI